VNVRAALPWAVAAACVAVAACGAARLHALEARASAAESSVAELTRRQAGFHTWLLEQEAIVADFQRQIDRLPRPVLPAVGDWEGVMR